MAIKKQFDWDNLPWQDLQKLCLHLAQDIFPNTSFEEYLSVGNRQDGIDLITVHQPDEKPITIQCKKEPKLTVSDVQKIINEFESNHFVGIAGEFILATSAILDSKVVSYLQDEKVRLKETYAIELRSWDRRYLEDQLRRNFTLVAYYFNAETAEQQCHEKSSLTATLKSEPVTDYIPRKIHLNRTDLSPEQRRYLPIDTKTTTLTEVINASRMTTKHICLVADAYQGKSLLLRQTAWELQQKVELPFQPLLMECKYQVIQPVELMLYESFGQWKSIPGRDLAIFIDGMDEVPGDKFQDMLAYIRSFSRSHQHITLVFSCRKIFYEHYEVGSVLGDFTTYELHPLDEAGIKHHIQNKLPGHHRKFETFISTTGLNYFLYHPFFLSTLLEIFKDKPGKMPTSKANVLEVAIERSFDHQCARRIAGGLSVKDKMLLYKSAIQRLALALQLSGLNALAYEHLQALFTSEEIELLKVNTLITKYQEFWGFTNALFQEHLAALQLMDMPYDTIISFISVGNSIKKVKTKWIETTSSLLSLMDEKSSIYNKLLEFVESDNIELLFTTEKSKFTNTQRLSLLKKLFNRLINKNLRPILIYEDKIAQFIQGDDQAVAFLIETAFDKHIPSIAKQTAIRVLQRLNGLGRHRESFFNQAMITVANTNEWNLAFNLIEVLTENKMGTHSTVATLLSRKEFCMIHSYRTAIYQYLVIMGWVDEYYDFGLEGITNIVVANDEIHHAGSEFWWEEFLLATKKPFNLKRLLYEMRKDIWKRCEEQRSVSILQLNRKIADKAIAMFPSDPTIALAVTALCRNIDRKYKEDSYIVWNDFFTQTNSHDLAVRASIDRLFTEAGWFMSRMVRASSFDYLMTEWEYREESSLKTLRIWLNQLRNKQIPEATQFHDLLIDATEGTLFADVSNVLDDNEKTDQIKRTNDLLYIRDQQMFKNAVEAFFKAFGNTEIEEQVLHVHMDGNLHRRNADSNFVYYFLLRWVPQKDGIISFSKAIEVIENAEIFEQFRAAEILHYPFIGTPEEDVLIGYARDYFSRHLSILNFENAYTDATYRPLHVFIGELFERFEFNAPAEQLMELVWLDASGVRGFANNKQNNTISISEKILNKFSPAEKIKFEQKIISNLKTGIKAAGVLGTHLQLCKLFNLEEALDIILDLLYKNPGVNISPTDLLEIHQALGGSLSVLVTYFEQMDNYDYDYFKFAQTLIEEYPTEVHQSMKKCLETPQVDVQWKVKAARYCCILGDFGGFEFLVQRIEENLIAPYSIQSFSNLHLIDTSQALSRLQSLSYLLLSPHKKSHFSESPKLLIIEWLTLFAMKGEADLYQVIRFYDQAFEELNAEHINAHDLFWYQEMVIEKFRDSDKTVYPLSKVKQILQETFD